MSNDQLILKIIKKSKKDLTAYDILDELNMIKKTQPMTVYRELNK